MKKSHLFRISVFLLITSIIFVSTTIFFKIKIDKQVFKVYSFEGESGGIKITDGLIIISPNKQTISGGKIQYTNSKQEKIQSYIKSIYLDKQGNKDIVVATSASSNKVILFPDELLLNKDIGEVSGKKLFSEDDMNSFKDNLYFSLDYLTVDGQTGNSIIKLKVKEFNMNE